VMKIHTLFRTQFLPIPLKTAWVFFSSPGNLSLITPQKMNFEILSMTGGEKMHEGQLITYRVNVLPLVRVKWVTEITSVRQFHSFTDNQKSGPYRLWRHTHTFREVEGGVEMTDQVEYALPLGILGEVVHAILVKREVSAIFEYRFKVLQDSKIFNS
jgi:ligand-binding SRPBCC domain-containing protein